MKCVALVFFVALTVTLLPAGCDVFLDAYRPGALAARGFGAEDLSRGRTDVVSVSLSTFSRGRPYAGRRGYGSPVRSTMTWPYKVLVTRRRSFPSSHSIISPATWQHSPPSWADPKASEGRALAAALSLSLPMNGCGSPLRLATTKRGGRMDDLGSCLSRSGRGEEPRTAITRPSS